MIEFNPYDWKLHEDPYPTYRDLRDHAPVYRNVELGFYALSRHADVVSALRDTATYSSNDGPALERLDRAAVDVASFLAMDPPQHDHVRDVIWHMFSRQAVGALETTIRRLAVEYLERIDPTKPCEFMGEFAAPLPMDVISEIVGIPREDREKVRKWADDVVHRDDYQSEVPPAAMLAGMQMLGYFYQHVAKRRQSPDSESLTDVVIRAQVNGRPLTDAEIVPLHFLLGVAGGETTTKLLGNALYWLWKYPAERARVCLDPKMTAACVEETARFESSSQMVARTATCDVMIHGVTIPKGARVALLLGSANRDERVFPDADTFDAGRKMTQTLAFGHGVHFCLGAWLARLEGRICLEEILKRFPDYEIDEAGIERMHSPNVRGFARLPIRFRPS